ncbi:hypothetical protein EOM86_03620 [Candidatus Nomurabacteria bacterium]|nr:hypothetical protein [Candidatus Nomurabacteria bacterium]
MHSKRGHIEIALIFVAVIVLFIIPVQINLIRVLLEQADVILVEDVIETASINAISHLNPQKLGEGDISFNIKNAKDSVIKSIERMINESQEIRIKGHPKVEISVRYNVIHIETEVRYNGKMGKERSMVRESEFIVELPEVGT